MHSQVSHKKQLKATMVLGAHHYYAFAEIKGRKKERSKNTSFFCCENIDNSQFLRANSEFLSNQKVGQTTEKIQQ